MDGSMSIRCFSEAHTRNVLWVIVLQSRNSSRLFRLFLVFSWHPLPCPPSDVPEQIYWIVNRHLSSSYQLLTMTHFQWRRARCLISIVNPLPHTGRPTFCLLQSKVVQVVSNSNLLIHPSFQSVILKSWEWRRIVEICLPATGRFAHDLCICDRQSDDVRVDTLTM